MKDTDINFWFLGEFRVFLNYLARTGSIEAVIPTSAAGQQMDVIANTSMEIFVTFFHIEGYRNQSSFSI